MAREIDNLLKLEVFAGVADAPVPITLSPVFRRAPAYREFINFHGAFHLGIGRVYGEFLEVPLARTYELYELDPLLAKYESEYHYLFAQLVAGSTASSGGMDSFYHYLNIGRRVIEAFLAFRTPDLGSDEASMFTQLHSLKFDEAKTNRILNFLNAHSHNMEADNSVDHGESVLLETPDVLKDLLALMEHSDQAHVSAMRKVLLNTA